MKLSQHSKSALQVVLQFVVLLALFVAIVASVPANLTQVDTTAALSEPRTAAPVA